MRRVATLIRAAACAATIGIGHVAVTLAQAQSNEGFVPARPGDIQTERLPATPLVFGAYAIVWIAVTLYVLTLWRRIAKAERELAAVAARLEQQRR